LKSVNRLAGSASLNYRDVDPVARVRAMNCYTLRKALSCSAVNASMPDRLSSLMFLNVASQVEKAGINFKQTGDGTSMTWPAGRSLPVAASTRKVTIVSEF
jgi:hypothetical protein